ncbi:26127_t:CDS:1, partial [Racocetra persica]
ANRTDAKVIKKNFMTRQATYICDSYFDYIHKSSTSTKTIPANTINTHLTIECNIKGVLAEVLEYHLWKDVNGKKSVDMKGVKLDSLAKNVAPKNGGWFIIKRYALHADPSECLNAPKGLVVSAIAKIKLTYPDGNIDEGYPIVQNVLKGCPPSSTKPKPSKPTKPQPSKSTKPQPSKSTKP